MLIISRYKIFLAPSTSKTTRCHSSASEYKSDVKNIAILYRAHHVARTTMPRVSTFVELDFPKKQDVGLKTRVSRIFVYNAPYFSM